MQLLLIAQSLILPLVLSFLLSGVILRNEWIRSTGLLLIWLLVYFWIRGLSPLVPAEALDWLWIFSIAMLLSTIVIPLNWRWPVFAFVFVMSLVVYAWPVLRYQFTVLMAIEIVSLGIIAALAFFRAGQKWLLNPALVICTSAGGLAVVAALSGSLLVGQLACGLAASAGGFAFFELTRRKIQTRLGVLPFTLLLGVYFALLFIGRIYAEFPVMPSAILAVSPLCAVFITWRFNWLACILLNAIAISMILLASDSANYY